MAGEEEAEAEAEEEEHSTPAVPKAGTRSPPGREEGMKRGGRGVVYVYKQYARREEGGGRREEGRGRGS